MSLIPLSTEHLVPYQDTCGGQNKDSGMAAMLSKVVREHPTLQIIEHKFLEPGHIHLKCDSDHVCIERYICRNRCHKIYICVHSVRGKIPLKSVEIKREDFLTFSLAYQKCLMKKNMDFARQMFVGSRCAGWDTRRYFGCFFSSTV
jgi:hypothetical protein